MVSALDDRLKGLKCLNRALEADRARQLVMDGRGLGHDGANKVISQDVRPDLLSHQLWRLAAKFMHLQSAFDRTQIKLIVPTRTIESCQVVGSSLLVIEQRRYGHDRLGAKARLGNRNERFSNRDVLRQLLKSVPVQRANGGRLVPADDVIVAPEPFSAPEVGPAVRLVQTSHQLDTSLLEQQDIQPIVHQTIG